MTSLSKHEVIHLFKHFFSATVCGTRTTPRSRKKTTLNIVTSPRMKTKWQWWFLQRQKRRAHLLALWNSTWEVRQTLNRSKSCTCANLSNVRTSGARAPAEARTSHAIHHSVPREVRGLISVVLFFTPFLALLKISQKLCNILLSWIFTRKNVLHGKWK